MTCREVRDSADAFVRRELVAEASHDILRHLETCRSCRTEIESRRRLAVALRAAFTRAHDLEPAADFKDRLRERLREPARPAVRRPTLPGRWLAVAAALVLVVGATFMVLLDRPAAPGALAQDAIDDHRYCALADRTVRRGVPLDEAAQRFDSAYRVMLNTPPDDIPTPDGHARVVERHSCESGAHRFAHVILQYRGRVVSLLVTATDSRTGDTVPNLPKVISGATAGMTVVSVNGPGHTVMLVSDMERHDLTTLAGVVSAPLARRLADVAVNLPSHP